VYRQVIMFRFRLYSCWWEQWYPFCLRWWRATKWWCICWAGFRRRSQDCSVEESQAHGQEIHWWSVNGVQIGPVMFSIRLTLLHVKKWPKLWQEGHI